jgi:hypothetical protein
MSLCPSLLQATVTTDVFYPSLLYYHYNNIVVATSQLPITTVGYGPILQCMFITMKHPTNFLVSESFPEEISRCGSAGRRVVWRLDFSRIASPAL